MMEGRKREDIRRYTSGEAIQSKAENFQSFQFSKSVGRNGARESKARKSKSGNTGPIGITGDAYPSANLSSVAPVELWGMGYCISKCKKSLFI